MGVANAFSFPMNDEPCLCGSLALLSRTSLSSSFNDCTLECEVVSFPNVVVRANWTLRRPFGAASESSPSAVPRREMGAMDGCGAGDPLAGCDAGGSALTVGSKSAGSFVVRCDDSAGGALKGNSSSSPGDRGSPVGADFVMMGAPLFAGADVLFVS